MNSTVEMFSMIQDYCRQLMPAGPYNLWIRDIVCEKFDYNEAVLLVPTDFRKQVIEAKYLEFLTSAFIEVLGFEVRLSVVSEEERAAAAAPEQSEAPVVPSCDPSGIAFGLGNNDYTFASFIVGASNKFAHAASLAVATNPASSYNPLFIYGDSGLGKTHLLYAICNEIGQNHPDYNMVYVKGEDFTNDLITAIRTEQTAAFHEKYRKADVLLVDDIQFISGKEMTQEEFFHTFNSLYESNKQIVLTSDRPPKDIKTLEDRLRTRFEMGLLADVQPPDYETRVAIIHRKAETLGFSLPDDVTEFLATKVKTNIRQLEGTVKKIMALSQHTGSQPSIAMAQNAIRDILNDNQPISVVVDRIINEVSRYFDVSPGEMISMERTASISTARQAAMYIIREVTHLSMAAIGQEFSNRDHSTVVYTINQTKKLMKKNPHFKNTIEDIIKNVQNR